MTVIWNWISIHVPDYPDVPAAYDDGGNTFSFIDGHVEHHKWLYQASGFGLLACPYSYGVVNNSAHWPSSIQDMDWKWLQIHTACKTGVDYQ